MPGTDELRDVIAVEPAVLLRLQEEAERASPQECCGILLGTVQIEGGNSLPLLTDLLPAANIAPDPQHLFEIDPAVLIAAYRAERSGGPCVIGFYHSHPHSAPVPSATDQAMAARDGKVWAIAGWGAPDLQRELQGQTHENAAKTFTEGPVITFWRDDQAGFSPLSYSLTQR